jgi:hypothetical protein
MLRDAFGQCIANTMRAHRRLEGPRELNPIEMLCEPIPERLGDVSETHPTQSGRPEVRPMEAITPEEASSVDSR